MTTAPHLIRNPNALQLPPTLILVEGCPTSDLRVGFAREEHVMPPDIPTWRQKEIQPPALKLRGPERLVLQACEDATQEHLVLHRREVAAATYLLALLLAPRTIFQRVNKRPSCRVAFLRHADLLYKW